MQTLLSKWTTTSTTKQPTFRYGQGISSTDYLQGYEDATQLEKVPDVDQVVKQGQQSQQKERLGVSDPQEILAPTRSHTSGGLDRSIGKRSGSFRSPILGQKPSTPTMLSADEFGALPSGTSSQQAFNGQHARYHTDSRLPSSKTSASKMSSSTSTKKANVIKPSPSSLPLIPPSYGYTPVGWDHQMDVTKAVEIVMACSEQIKSRGLDSPLIFSTMALDLSSHAVSSLIKSLIHSPSSFLTTDVRFANPHDLAAVVKWTLARLGRVFSVPIPSPERGKKSESAEMILIHQRGFLEIETYVRWAGQERKNEYPPTAFTSFLNNLSSSSLALLVAVFSLLSSTTAYSLRNGMTPSRLARLFGPLLFGLPEDETFDKTYEAYVKAGNATEHLLLAYIRDASTLEPLPTRLADHIKGYPLMLSPELSKPSRSVRGVPMTHVNRTVRLYSIDLVQTGCEMEVADQCSEWKACCSNSDAIGKDPQLSDRYRKLINLRSSKKQGRGKAASKVDAEEIHPYGSLADKKWGDFMSEGFAAPDQSKLAFDLRESDRKARQERAESVPWSQFEKSGFLLEDDGLDSVLSFGDDLRDDIERWPTERAELMEKLRKTTKMMPNFPYDTVPYIVSSPTLDVNEEGQWATKPISKFDEVFAEVFADVLLGNGWSNRDEQTHRNANFVIVQYKSRPTASTVRSESVASTLLHERGYVAPSDDRSDAAWFVIEEVVPSQYRSELEASGRHKSKSRASLRKLNVFRRRERDAVPSGLGIQSEAPLSSLSAFDELLKPGLGGVTKRLQLSKDPTTLSPSTNSRRDSGSTIRQANMAGLGSDGGGDTGASTGGAMHMIKTLRSKTIKMKRRVKEETDDDVPPPPPPKSGMGPSPSFTSADFETRSVHEFEVDGDDDEALTSRRHNFLLGGRVGKRQSKDDTWLDVMLRSNESGRSSPAVTEKAEPRLAMSPAAVDPEIIRSITPVRTSSLPRDVPKVEESKQPEEGQALGLRLTPSPQREVSPSLSSRRKPSPSSEEPVGQQSRDGSVSRDTLQAAGWTVEASAGSGPTKDRPVTPSREARLSKDDTSGRMSPEQDTARESTLAYLRPLPPRSANGAIDDRERARELRIQAAKERARELRANLSPSSAAMAAADDDSARPHIQKGGEHLKPLLTPVKARLSSSPVASPDSLNSSPSSQQKLSTPKDDPFAKDRFSGRVATVASKFGGASIKPITPQSTGNSIVATSSPTTSVDPSRGQAAASKTPSTDAKEVLIDEDDISVDHDDIYPEDAASNFSRDASNEEEVSRSVNDSPKTSLRPGGSIAAAVSMPTYNQSPSGLPGPLPDVDRREDEDEAMDLAPSYRVPYQPGMPLSNLEEESESVVSGSNL